MNVNLDVLELIFKELSGSDLVASSLVSRAFLAGAIPSLYSTIEYTPRHAKRDPLLVSPFATLATHDHLVVHVKRIAVHAAPTLHPTTHQVNPLFLRDLAHTLRTAANLLSFVCTAKILPPLLPPLIDKHRLSHLRIWASLGHRQIAVLQERIGLHSLSLDFPSWNVIDVLPKWSLAMQRTLAHLTLFMSQDIDISLLNTTLSHLPRLRGLHVIGCPKITHIAVLKALSHTPDLHELSFTVFPSQENVLPPLNFSTPPLTHLSIDVRASYPGLKSLIARVISRLSPRDALAICGGWIGEIKGSSERNDTPQGDGTPSPPGLAAGTGGNQNPPVWHGHIHLHGPLPAHGQANVPPLLSPPTHHGNAHPNHHPGPPPPNPDNQGPPPNLFGFPFTFPLGNLNDTGDEDDNEGPQDLPNPDFNPDPNWPSLVDSFPLTLSVLHLPQISPTGLREVLDRCQAIQLLGIVIGSTFAAPAPIKASKSPTSRVKPHTLKTVGVKPEINALATVLSRARKLRELIIDTSAVVDISGSNSGPGSDSRSGTCQVTLLTPPSVRMLMRESPCLRRIVGEGRVWESQTPIPSSPVPFPRCLDIELTLTRARYGPGVGNHHAHGPPGFGSHGGGYGQMEASNEHWFWLAGSASGGKVYTCF